MQRWMVMGSALVLGAGSLVSGEQQVLVPVADTTIYSESDDLSNGAGGHLFAGQTIMGSRRRALLRFDIASVIPPGSIITEVTLDLAFSRALIEGRDVSVHRLTADWGEGASEAGGEEGGGTAAQIDDATWAYRFYADEDPSTSPAWSTPGGDFEPTASATVTVSGVGSTITWQSTTQMVADVQSWLDNPASDFGWILVGDETGPGAKRFDSRQFEQPERAPMLTITFDEVAATGACCLADDSCEILTVAACADAGGSYQGDGSVCSASICDEPSGACCLPSAFCADMSETACDEAGGSFEGAGTSCASVTCPLVLEPFVDALPIPAIHEPDVGTTDVYTVTLQEVRQKLHRDLPPTVVWGYDGVFPGPTFNVRSQEPITVIYENQLRDITTGMLREEHYLTVDECMHGPDMDGTSPRTVAHLHGGHLPAESDGHPDDTIDPGEMQIFDYPNNQGAGTSWYHDHALGITRLNTYMGLAGAYVIRDDVDDALGLPAGDYELPMIFTDRTFNPDGTLVYPEEWHEHFFGEFVLVNGMVHPYLEVDRGKYRIRLVNGSGSRTYRFALSDDATMVQIGVDGGLLEAPVALSELVLAPGERADMIFDFEGYAPGTEIILTNDAPSPFPFGAVGTMIPEILKFVVTDADGHTDPIPETLRTIEQLDEADAIEHRSIVLRKDAMSAPDCSGPWWLLNGLLWDDITEFPRLGTTEVWSFANRSGIMHPMHMHLVFFQVIGRQPFMLGSEGEVIPTGDLVPPDPNERGWKDTVRVNPNEVVHVIARFDDYLGRFPYHCHILEHEDHEMMRQFEVIPCWPCEFDGNTSTLDVLDLLAFLDAYFADLGGPPSGGIGTGADFAADNVVDVLDVLEYIACWLPASISGNCF